MAQPFEFTLQFSPGIGTVDAKNGRLVGVTVAEVGSATGHFAFTDAAGKVLGVGGAEDAECFKGAVKRLQLGMDEKSLQTVVAAGQLSKRFKTREDHDDSIEARAGFSENFRMEGGKVVCDQTIFDSYRNRGVFMEAATETPELIGLSGDFKFTTEVIGERAMMRVTRIDAVDIVDQGALTHAGLFRARASLVDTPESETLSIMAKSAPTKPDMKAFKTMCAEIAAYRAEVQEEGTEIDECMALLDPKIVGNASPVEAPLSTMTAAEKTALTTELTTSLSAVFTAKLTELQTSVASQIETASKAQAVEFGKKMSALGIKGAAAAEPTAEELAKAQAEAAALAAKNGAGKDYLSLKAARAKEKKISAAQAGREIASEHPEVFNEYRVKLGICKPDKAA